MIAIIRTSFEIVEATYLQPPKLSQTKSLLPLTLSLMRPISILSFGLCELDAFRLIIRGGGVNY